MSESTNLIWKGASERDGGYTLPSCRRQPRRGGGKRRSGRQDVVNQDRVALEPRAGGRERRRHIRQAGSPCQCGLRAGVAGPTEGVVSLGKAPPRRQCVR